VKRHEYQTVARAIVAAIPGFTSKRRLLMLRPVGRILRGLYVEDSSTAGQFYLWVFIQPLYVPATTVTFALGQRLGGGSRTWRAGEVTSLIELIRSDGLPFLTNKDSAEKLADFLERSGNDDANTLEAKAYSLVAADKFDDAIAPFDTLTKMLDDHIPWQREKKEKVQRLRTFCTSTPDKASQTLRDNEQATRKALGLDDTA
jgi:hypothetical protein